MTYLISLVHAAACVLIVLFILLQHPKGGGILGALGGGMGGGKSLFSAGGASGFLVQTTKWLTVVFALTSLSLSYMSAHQKDIMKDSSAPIAVEQPVEKSSPEPQPSDFSETPTN